MRLPMMVASLLLRYSTSLDSAMTSLKRVMTTPQGTGAPTNLWPLTDTEPMGLRNDTMGAFFRNGIIMPNSAPSQWM